jgi:hypothetical protein
VTAVAEPRSDPSYIDEHAREIDASPQQIWRALLFTLGHGFLKLPGWLTAAWGLEHSGRSPTWEGAVSIGDTVPGFIVAEVAPAHLLALRGRHRFADYELRFELRPAGPGATRLSAITCAAFPGLTGRLYRALVIGSGGHRVAVRRLLTSVERRSQR